MTTATDYEFDRSRLALSYDADALEREVVELLQGYPPYIHYNIIPLTQPGTPRAGVEDYSDPDWTTWVNTPALEACPAIRGVLDSLACRKTNVRLMRLEPGGELKEHCDPQLDLGLRNQIRLHVPIVTSQLVDFVLNGTLVPLAPGELWYLRLSDPHSVRNRGDRERIQLSIDVVYNEWIERMILEGERA